MILIYSQPTRNSFPIILAQNYAKLSSVCVKNLVSGIKQKVFGKRRTFKLSTFKLLTLQD